MRFFGALLVGFALLGTAVGVSKWALEVLPMTAGAAPPSVGPLYTILVGSALVTGAILLVGGQLSRQVDALKADIHRVALSVSRLDQALQIGPDAGKTAGRSGAEVVRLGRPGPRVGAREGAVRP